MKTAVFIGRFQPPHKAHLETMQRALKRHNRLIVVLGSAESYPNFKNPFSAPQREAMIRAALEEAGAKGELRFVYVPDDYYDDPRWFRAVRTGVLEVTPNKSHIYLTGFNKDESSYYLMGFPDWPFEESGVSSPLNATDVRKAYFAGDENWKTMVPPAVQRFLEDFAQTPEYPRLQAEYQTIEHYKKLDKTYPYPINQVAVDAVVLCSERVLLIERGGAIGKGAWALPGGYLETKETLLQGAKRELTEETKLHLLDPVLEQSLKAVQVFDYPGRSARGRVIAHAHLFDLGPRDLPKVEGHDDASKAFWLPLEQLQLNRSRFHDDHYQIIRWFLERRH